ncbi:MAG: FG-GAP-like repeat-containing protein [Rhizomicrobium sp.]
MIVPGQFAVSSTGAATYMIPITVPPGTAGMVPALSLSYSSQSGDGIVGWGWALSGLPSVVRCPKTLAQDGVHGGVRYDSNDRFCLEGQRLVAISGTYGADSTEYRTEIDGFSKIVSYGAAGSGPSYFRVWTKSGQIMEFGNSTDSKLLAVGTSTARSWAVNKIGDRKGNYLTVSYTNDATNGQAYPTRVDYTGNASAGLGPYNSVQFVYATRGDITPTYQAGSLQQTTVVLTNIKTYQGANLVYDYRLAYRTGTSTVHSRLTSVTLCDGAGACLAPTTFGWQGGTGTLSYSTAALSLMTGTGTYAAPGDFNGDGLTDLAINLDATMTCPTGGSIYDVTATGTYTQANMGMCLTGAMLSNQNADGYTDLALDSASGAFSPAWTYLYTNNRTGGFTLSQLITSGRWVTFGDFNGDGYGLDYVHNGTVSGTTDVTSFVGSPYGGTTVTLSTPWVANFITGDFDGDGCDDVWAPNPANKIYLICGPSVPTITVPNWSAYNVVLGDFNGDGKLDVLAVPASGAGTMRLSTGTSLVATSFTVPTAWDGKRIAAGDWNGDGKTDIAVIDTTTTFYLSTGTGFVSVTTASTTGTIYNATRGDWNSDGADDLLIRKSTGDVQILFSNAPELITSISNGVGSTTAVSYDRLNKNGSFYARDTSASYPTEDVDGPLYLVSRIDQSNGVGGTYSSTYAYGSGKTGLTGRGFLGFANMTITDLQTGVVQTTNYRTDFPYVGLTAWQTKTAPKTGGGTVTISSTVNTYEAVTLGSGGTARSFVALTQSVVSGDDEDFATGATYAMPTTTTNYTFDCDSNPNPCYGEATNVVVSTLYGAGTSTKTNGNAYADDAANWILGRVTYSTVESVVGSSDIVRHTCFQYESGTGVLTREEIEPSSSACNSSFGTYTVEIDYTLDSYGHRTATATSGDAITSRSSGAGFDSFGEFQTSGTNALSQNESWTHSAAFGSSTSHTGPNGLTTSWTYDTFGRITQETVPIGTKTNTSYAYCSGVNGGSASCPTNGAFLRNVTPVASDGVTQIGPKVTTYYDCLSRAIAMDGQGFDGSTVRQATQYDADGRVQQTSRPYFLSGGTAKWTVFTYDALGRVTRADLPDGSHMGNTFQGLTTVATNALGQTTTSTNNAQGQIASVADNAGHTTSYVYDALGNLKTVTDSAGNVTSTTYDLRGNKTAASDPDLGSWSYTYDVLGEMLTQTDAKLQTATLTYDLLGRVATRNENNLYTAWTYGTSAASHNVGQLVEVKACTNSGCGSVVSDKTIAYDSLGRTSTVSLATGGSTYITTTTYDGYGRAATVASPSGFVQLNVYTSLSYLSQIKDNGTAATLWTANARDAELHLTQQTAGNGVVTTDTYDANTGLLTNVRAGPSDSVAAFDYTYDSLGNLTYRSDNYQGVFERYCYDNLNRLTNSATGASGVSSCTSSGGGITTKTVGYDALGNITSKSDIGTYSYPSAGSARPHAVASIVGTVNGVTNPAYTYDSNGSLTAGAGRTVSYTAFNMADTITQGATSSAFAYDGDHARLTQTLTVGGTATTTTYLYGTGTMAEKSVTGGMTTWHDYLMADGKMVGERFCTGGAPCTSGAIWFFFVLDHLGSIAVIADGSGAVTERLSYDAWGRRRNSNGTDNTSCGVASGTTRGFTGQEEIDAVCLVNLNARLYDSTLGRFMSADPMTENWYNQQILNRYSYVGNNPLSFTDPSGLCFLGCFWKHIPILGSLIDALIAKPIWNTYLAIKTNPLKFALYEIGKIVVSYVTAGITDFLEDEFDIASMQLGGVSGDVLVSSTLNSAGTAAIGTGIYGGNWNYVLLASADGAVTPIINAQFAPAFDDPNGAGTGGGLTPDQMNSTQIDWGGAAEHALAMGAKDAAIAYALGRNALDAFSTGAVGTFSSDVYRSYVHQDPNLIGTGDGGVDKLGNNWVIGYGVNNWGRWWSSTEGPQAFYEEGGWLSQFMDVLPGMDPTSMLHDVWSVQYLNTDCFGMDTCPTMMAPAYYVSAMALSSKYIPAYGLPGKDCRKSDEHHC